MLDSMKLSPIAQYSPASFHGEPSRRQSSTIRQGLAQQSPPLRTSTFPPHTVNVTTLKKRIIVCCDGTWQDGNIVDERWKHTNVLRLSRAVRHIDDRVNPPIAQFVFYQSGVGAANNIYSRLIDGATGASLAEKVEEAYAFITLNYHPGDEIFLFGFSRGAYTARMIASLIGKIGVLNRTEMDHFAEIFIALQKLDNQEDLEAEEKKKLETILAPWTGPNSPGCKRATGGPEGFSVKCVGVFDTVGSVGLPEEVTRQSGKMKTLLGFHSTELGPHIQRAYQALALDERRADFDCAKFHQTAEGRVKKQVLQQCWFAGCHSDIGGGYQQPDLANLTLTWMAAHVGDILYLDINYLASLLEAVQPWGQLPPHDSVTGVFKLAETIQRRLPTETDFTTHETIHPSVLVQKDRIPGLADIVQKNPSVVCKLMPLEDELRKNWKVTGNDSAAGVQRLGAAIETMHSPEQLARDPDKADAAHEAAGTGYFGSWLVPVVSRSNEPVAISPSYLGGVSALVSSIVVATYYYFLTV